MYFQIRGSGERRSPAARKRSNLIRKPASLGQRIAEQNLDLRVHATEFARSPAGDRIVYRGIESQEDLLPFAAHDEYKVPVLTTGDAGWSLHNTTIRLLTIAALRSSSRVT